MPDGPPSIEPSARARAMRESAPRRRAFSEPATPGPNVTPFRTSGVSDNLYAVWGSGPTDVFAVGDKGRALHYQGSWSPSNTGIQTTLRGLQSKLAVGDAGTILPVAISRLAIGILISLLSVFAISVHCR